MAQIKFPNPYTKHMVAWAGNLTLTFEDEKPKEDRPAIEILKASRNVNPDQLKVLKVLVKEFSECPDGPFLNFKEICRKTKFNRRKVRLACRALARKGLAEFGTRLWNSHNDKPAGAGYAATTKGKIVLDILK